MSEVSTYTKRTRALVVGRDLVALSAAVDLASRGWGDVTLLWVGEEEPSAEHKALIGGAIWCQPNILHIKETQRLSKRAAYLAETFPELTEETDYYLTHGHERDINEIFRQIHKYAYRSLLQNKYTNKNKGDIREYKLDINKLKKKLTNKFESLGGSIIQATSLEEITYDSDGSRIKYKNPAGKIDWVGCLYLLVGTNSENNVKTFIDKIVVLNYQDEKICSVKFQASENLGQRVILPTVECSGKYIIKDNDEYICWGLSPDSESEIKEKIEEITGIDYCKILGVQRQSLWSLKSETEQNNYIGYARDYIDLYPLERGGVMVYYSNQTTNFLSSAVSCINRVFAHYGDIVKTKLYTKGFWEH